jgi:hypothetical protein
MGTLWFGDKRDVRKSVSMAIVPSVNGREKEGRLEFCMDAGILKQVSTRLITGDLCSDDGTHPNPSCFTVVGMLWDSRGMGQDDCSSSSCKRDKGGNPGFDALHLYGCQHASPDAVRHVEREGIQSQERSMEHRRSAVYDDMKSDHGVSGR